MSKHRERWAHEPPNALERAGDELPSRKVPPMSTGSVPVPSSKRVRASGIRFYDPVCRCNTITFFVRQSPHLLCSFGLQ